jgi:cathepsin X
MTRILGLGLVVFLIPVVAAFERCAFFDPMAPVVSRVLTPPPTPLNTPLPSSLDWRNVSNANLVTADTNQHLPTYCGCCWLWAPTTALADRFRIALGPSVPEVALSVQTGLNCAGVAGSCHGGSPFGAQKYLHDAGLPDSSCEAYVSVDQTCDALGTCQSCVTGKCAPARPLTVYRAKEFGGVKGEQNMMAELSRGPIACGIAVTKEFERYTGGIFRDTTNATDIDHIISVVGYGEEEGAKVWYSRNSWSMAWGERGWFRIVRGVNNLNIETACSWATPDLSTLPAPLPPASAVVDWRLAGPITPVRTSVSPRPCHAEWIFAVASMASDRASIATRGAFPRFTLSPQSIMNFLGASCEGPSSVDDLTLAVNLVGSRGFVDESCSPWQGLEGLPFSPECRNCMGFNSTCPPFPNPPRLGFSGSANFTGSEAMAWEIQSGGPIACALAITDEMLAYTGGVFTQQDLEAPYRVGAGVVVGFAEDFWIVKMSFGTMWGEQGYIRIARGPEDPMQGLFVETWSCGMVMA